MAPFTLLPTVCTSGTRTWWFWFSAVSTYARTYSKESRIPVETLEFFLFFQMPLILLYQVTLKAIFKCSKYIFMSSFVCVIWWCMCFYMCRCWGQGSWDGCQAFFNCTLIFVELLSEPGQQAPGSPVPTLPEHGYWRECCESEHTPQVLWADTFLPNGACPSPCVNECHTPGAGMVPLTSVHCSGLVQF